MTSESEENEASSNGGEEVGEALCCCEYINDQGEKSHIFGCCCDCDSIDDTFERLIQRQPQPKGRFNEIFSIFLDRLRIPWINGAIKIELDVLLPILLVPVLLLLGTLGPIWTIISLLLFPISIQVLRRSFLYKIPRTKFFMSFAISGIIFNFLIFEHELISFMEILHIEYSINIILLCLTLYSMHRTKTSGKEDETLLKSKLPSFYFCRICQFYIVGRDHHCVWIDCCIGKKNKKWFISTLVFASLHLTYNVLLTLTTICYPKYLFRRFILVPSSCPDIYSTIGTSLCFVCSVYGIVVVILLVAILIHQSRLVYKGVSYLEWKYQNIPFHQNQSTKDKLVKSDQVQDIHKA